MRAAAGPSYSLTAAARGGVRSASLEPVCGGRAAALGTAEGEAPRGPPGPQRRFPPHAAVFPPLAPARPQEDETHRGSQAWRSHA